jgi:hypothetical protein
MKTTKIKSTIWLSAALLILGVSHFSFGVADAASEQLGHRTVTGTISKLTSEMIVLKTNEGTTRSFTVKEMKREGIGGLSVGDQVTLSLDEGNQIVDIDKKSSGGPSVGESEHRSVTGNVMTFDRVKKEVTLKEKGGKSQTYSLKDPAATKMANIKTGTQITMYIDEENGSIMDFDLQ